METKKGRSIRRTIEDLSDDLTLENLRFLPLTSIVQCRDVCERWRSLITRSPHFLTNTINVAVSFNYDYYVHDLKYLGLESQRGGNQISALDFFIDFPNKSLYHYQILSSCNGLLFSYHFIKGRVDIAHYISNPWTKECVRLPNQTMSYWFSLYGLALENNSKDGYDNNNVALYKIVIARRIKVNPSDYKLNIYSSDKNRWQLLVRASKPGPHLFCRLDQNAVYCNQVLYWQCLTKNNHALMFNLETETLGYLDMPADEYDGDRFSSRLIECDGQLHYIRMAPPAAAE